MVQELYNRQWRTCRGMTSLTAAGRKSPPAGRKTRLRVCIFDAGGVKSAFALLLAKVTKIFRLRLRLWARLWLEYGQLGK